MKPINFKNQAGVTLLEVLAYLGIAAVILIGAISMFGSAQGSAQSNDLTSQIVGLRSSVKTISAGQASYGTSFSPPVATAAHTNGLNQMLVQSNAVPSTLRTMKTAPWTINNSFGGVVYVDGSMSEFWIAYTNVPQEVCVKVAPQSSAGWLAISINSGSEYVNGSSPFGWITPAQAATDCTPGSTNVMMWRAR